MVVTTGFHGFGLALVVYHTSPTLQYDLLLTPMAEFADGCECMYVGVWPVVVLVRISYATAST